MTGVDTLKTLFDEKKIRVLQVFIQKPQDEFTLKEVIKKSKVPLATGHRIMKFLLDQGIVEMQKVKHLTIYKLGQTDTVKYLSKLLYEKPAPIARFVDLISPINGIDQAIMHGKETDSRANIVITGVGINKDEINLIVAQIREELNFTINHLILEPEQFNMLESMGQFSGSKTTLFAKD